MIPREVIDPDKYCTLGQAITKFNAFQNDYKILD